MKKFFGVFFEALYNKEYSAFESIKKVLIMYLLKILLFFTGNNLEKTFDTEVLFHTMSPLSIFEA